MLFKETHCPNLC